MVIFAEISSPGKRKHGATVLHVAAGSHPAMVLQPGKDFDSSTEFNEVIEMPEAFSKQRGFFNPEAKT